MLVVVRLPSAKYHTDLVGVTTENVSSTVQTVFAFAALQLLSFVLLSTLVRRNLGMKALYQLAFVLETQTELIQSKLMTWVLMMLAFRVVHFGTLSEMAPVSRGRKTNADLHQQCWLFGGSIPRRLWKWHQALKRLIRLRTFFVSAKRNDTPSYLTNGSPDSPTALKMHTKVVTFTASPRGLVMTAKTLVVAGAGVVGLAVARAAARRGLQVLLLEKNALVGQETSARNSEVIHGASLPLPPSNPLQQWLNGSCSGRAQLYAFCEEFGVPHARCGKLIVAQKHQAEALRAIQTRGLLNGVQDLQLLSQDEAQAIEPNVSCHEALFSPSTGIVDSHGLMLALQGDAEAHGAMIARCTAVQGGEFAAKSRSFVIRAAQSNGGGREEEIQEVECDYFVNATGMFAPDLLHQVVADGTLPSSSRSPLPSVPEQFAKGTYFKLGQSNRPFSHLVYPIPEVGGLGVHATVDLAGNVRFGPDVEWVDAVNYQPDASKAETFAERIRSYWPEARAELLEADYCGIRPKIQVGGAIYEDFYIAVRGFHTG
ncbi:hypothetical protein BBJ28_00022837 [Nothophytophthora sp. Chile5]|nr:hypothetical protein BBJ28_00022837 [Nothophytophthora sp. Chile5]